MKNTIQKGINKLTRFSFGSTSAIITNLALIIGLDAVSNAKLSIIGSLLMIGIADNISDTLGIHIYQESEGLKQKQVWISTITNFFSRLLISLGFVAIIIFLPLSIGIFVSVAYGLIILSIISYIVAINKKIDPWHSIIEHLVIAIVVIFVSKLFGKLIFNLFS